MKKAKLFAQKLLKCSTIDEIEKIKIVNRGISYPLNIVGWGLFTIVAGYGLFVALWYLSDSSI